MIKFFRKIRLRLIAEHRFRKYLLSAIGEIALVVLGILIALGVNNWNLKRIDSKKGQQLIAKLITQTTINQEKVTEEIEFYHYVETTSDSILAVFKTKNVRISQEDVTALLSVLTFDYHLNLDMTILTEATENATLTLLDRDELREAIYDFKNANDLFMQRETIINEDLQNHFMGYLYEHYNFARYFSGYEYLISEDAEQSTTEITESLFFKNYIVIRKLYLEELIENIETLRLKLIQLQKLLYEEKNTSSSNR